MQANQMFARPNIEIYDVRQLAGNFSSWNFGLGTPYDENTAQVAVMTINEIQQRALEGHPIRVGMFHMLSENAFVNDAFRDLVQTILMRVGYGCTNGEWRNLDMAVNQTIVRAVKCCGSFLAASDPEFMATLPTRDQPAVRENAEVWTYLVQLALGQVQYVPFNQMQSGGSVLSGVASSTQEALENARGLMGTTAGAFVDSSEYSGITQGRHNNDAGNATGRYAARMEKMYGKLEGSMQEALKSAAPATATESQYQSRLKRGASTPGVAPTTRKMSQAVANFDSDVTDFSKPLATTEVKAPAEPVEEETKTLFSVQIGNNFVEIIREIYESSRWKPSLNQPFHPAWCTRTHIVRYFESNKGEIIATLQKLTDEQKEIAMNYDAHGIDPTKGQPEPNVPVRVVREEAKALYASASEVRINVIVSEKFGAEEDVNGCIRSARVAGAMSNPVPDAYIKSGLINTPVIYASEMEANDDALVIRAIANSKTFAEAAGYISKIENDLARQTIDDTLVQAINRATECELGIGVRITSFAEDGPAIVQVLEDKKGALIGEKMASQQTVILQSNVRVIPATEAKTYADATLTVEDQQELPEETLKRVLFLQRNISATWVNFTDNELAIGVPAKGPAVISADSLGAVHEIARTVFEEAIGDHFFSEQYLITKDNVRYRLHRGMLNKKCFLLSKEVKPVL